MWPEGASGMQPLTSGQSPVDGLCLLLLQPPAVCLCSWCPAPGSGFMPGTPTFSNGLRGHCLSTEVLSLGVTSKGQGLQQGQGKALWRGAAWKWPHHTCQAGMRFVSLSLQPLTLAKHPRSPDSSPEWPVASVVAQSGRCAPEPLSASHPQPLLQATCGPEQGGGGRHPPALQVARDGPVSP